MSAPATNSGLVARTTPSTRSGSGLVNTSSVGMFGDVHDPAGGAKRRAGQRLPGKQTHRRGPCPGPGSAARRAAARRACAAISRSRSSRASQAATGSGSSSRQHVCDLLPERLRAPPRRQIGMDELGPRRCRTRAGAPVRRPGAEHSAPQRRGEHVPSERAGSRPSSACGAAGPERHPRALVLAERPHPGAVPRAARSRACRDRRKARARASDERRRRRGRRTWPAVVGDVGDRARELLLAGSVLIARICPGCTLAPKRTTSSASRRMVWGSGMEVAARALSPPRQRSAAAERERGVRLVH